VPVLALPPQANISALLSVVTFVAPHVEVEVATVTAMMIVVEDLHHAVTTIVASLAVITVAVLVSTMIDAATEADVTERKATAAAALTDTRAAADAMRATVEVPSAAEIDVVTITTVLALVTGVATRLLPARNLRVSMAVAVAAAETMLATIVTPAGKRTDEQKAQLWPHFQLPPTGISVPKAMISIPTMYLRFANPSFGHKSVTLLFRIGSGCWATSIGAAGSRS